MPGRSLTLPNPVISPRAVLPGGFHEVGGSRTYVAG
ncbi:MAG: hypothetical protein QOE54_3887, partial [Streptosporangiaceae bacterium]|nr:hypothetical protein [Streptosporangiaceae bacterium]